MVTPMSCKVQIAQNVRRFIQENVRNPKVYQTIVDCMRMVEDYPLAGRVYDPDCPAARPPFPCRYIRFADTPFTMYYTVDVDASVATVVSLVLDAGGSGAAL